MKLRIILSLIALMIWPASTLKSQPQPEQLNLPGDNLNLYAVMKIFQESETLEIFEKRLNEEDARVNNLDLNGDNYIDYIKVVDYVEKNVHYIVLQDAITPTETQDVAVFVVKRDPNGKVIIQLIGDEALYGKYYIVEPYYDTDKGATPNPGYYGNNNAPQTVVIHHTTEYEITAWPLIRFIFLPTYIAWHSPYYWGYYPPFWRPWTPWYWHEYYGYHYYWHNDYYSHYHHGEHYRYDGWHDDYYGRHHSSSNTVYTRKERGEFNSSYSKPESIKDGAAIFRKTHPDMVKADIKEPEVKDIRVAVRPDKQTNKAVSPDKAGNNTKGNPKMKWAKPANAENKSGAVKTGKMDNRQETVKPGKMDNRQETVKPGKMDNKSDKVNSSRSETKTGGTKAEKSRTIKKEEKKFKGEPDKRGVSRQGKKETKREGSKTSGGEGKSDRK